MSRMMIDCREVPSESGCTVTLHGEPEELLELAARHAVDVHDHVDGPELHDGLRAVMSPSWEPPSTPGAFVQVVEFSTDRIEEWGPIQERLVKVLGPDRPMRWSILTEDRDRPGTYVAFVEFGSYAAAMANSANPATGTWFAELSAVCAGTPAFRNLDVARGAALLTVCTAATWSGSATMPIPTSPPRSSPVEVPVSICRFRRRPFVLLRPSGRGGKR